MARMFIKIKLINTHFSGISSRFKVLFYISLNISNTCNDFTGKYILYCKCKISLIVERSYMLFKKQSYENVFLINVLFLQWKAFFSTDDGLRFYIIFKEFSYYKLDLECLVNNLNDWNSNKLSLENILIDKL